MSSWPFVSVIIPVRNEATCIAACLRSVLAQDYPGALEVLAADGMSGDGTRDILAQFRLQDSRVRLIDNHKEIAATGLNAAIVASCGDVLVRMDAHTRYAADYIRQCVQVLRDTGADNVGGPARTDTHNYRQRAVAAAYHSACSAGGARFHNVNYEGYVDTVTYGCWRREVFESIGLFDEELVRNQDDEHNLRLTLAGRKIWQAGCIKSWYQPRSSLRELFRQYMQYGYWKVRVIQKHKRPASIRHIIPGLALFAGALCACLAPLSWPAAWTLAVIVGLYAVLLALASLHAAAKHGLDLVVILPLVFACYHFGYGYGFLRGLWDFVIRKKKSRASFTSLTRAGRSSEIMNSTVHGACVTPVSWHK